MIRRNYPALTPSERKLANTILENYPTAGLATITAVAERAEVSTPTVARMVQKIGFKGFPQFHRALLDELEASFSGPTQRRDSWASEAPEAHLLNTFSQAVTENLGQTFGNIDSGEFDRAVARLADPSGRLYVVGGRITHVLADYAFTHFQAIRPRVTQMSASSASWPHYLLDMAEGDTLLLFDIRRYEANLLRLAELAAERGVALVLVTDQWMSPVARIADHAFTCWVEIPSGWDSNIATMMLLEVMIAATQEARWSETRDRYEALEQLLQQARVFRRPG